MSGAASSTQPTTDLGRRAVGCRLEVFWPEYEEWFEAVVKTYAGLRHRVVYEDGMEDVGILDSRNLWLLEDHKWVPMRIRWLDDDLELAAERPAGDEKRDAPAQREEKEEENPKEADGKEDGMGWPAAENIGGFMIGCDNCDKWYYGWCVDITEHEAKDIKKYICPKCVIESARKRSGKPLSKRMRTQAAKVQG